MNSKIHIPEISNNLHEDMEMLLNQAEITSCKARNTVKDMEEVVSKFIESLTDEATREYVFWKIVDEYICKKYHRPNHLRYLISKLEPKYLLVYQLILEGEVVYIGKTSDIHKRLITHSKNKTFDKVLITKCDNEYNQSVLEHTLIELIRPPLNKCLNLKEVDFSIVIPEFTDSRDFQLDFITSTNSPFGLVPKNHVWVGNGFASLTRLKNKPHWYR